MLLEHRSLGYWLMMSARSQIQSLVVVAVVVGGVVLVVYVAVIFVLVVICLLYTSPSPRDLSTSRMPSSA